jgi:sulfate adenylyltransferase
MRLVDGTLWPIPITLDIPGSLQSQLGSGARLVLRDLEGMIVAVLHVEDLWRPDFRAEAHQVYGTTDTRHPGVAFLFRDSHPYLVGGTLEVLQLPAHYDFAALRLTPRQLRDRFQRMGWRRIVAFQTRNPMHRAHYELTRRAASDADAGLLIHPVVGITKPGDVDHYTRVRCYRAILGAYGRDRVELALLPLAMRMAGPREALWHAIIRRNYGCTHFIVGRDHAGPGIASSGRPFYGDYAAQELVSKHEREVGITMIPFRNMVYVKIDDAYVPEDEVPPNAEILEISGTELRRRLAEGIPIPAWFTFPAVLRELQQAHVPRSWRGLAIFFTGLSGAGKSTIANVLVARFLEMGRRRVTLLDGDIVRRHLSSELGFSHEHRNLNIRRIGFVAAEVAKHGGIAICAPIAPYESARNDARRMIENEGNFILVYVRTPLEVCEQRDRKGLYAKARMGLIKNFTGVSDPYEPPADAHITIDTTAVSPADAAQEILAYLERAGYLTSDETNRFSDADSGPENPSAAGL